MAAVGGSCRIRKTEPNVNEGEGEVSCMEYRRILCILLVLFFLLVLVPPVLADDNGNGGDVLSTALKKLRQDRHHTRFTFEDYLGEGDRAKQGGDYVEALGNYNKAIDEIQSSRLSDPEKNKLTAEAYRKKAELYRVRQDWGDDALAARADEKAQSYIDQGTYTGPCPVQRVYLLTPLAGTVQEIRDFRDGSIMGSSVGSHFMAGFNAWYRAISPPASMFIEEHPLMKDFLRLDLAPLLGIVLVAQWIFTLLSFSPELAATAALITGGAMYGLIYIFPYSSLGLIVAGRTGSRCPQISNLFPAAVLWFTASGTALLSGFFVSGDMIGIAASVILVLLSMVLSAGVSSCVFCAYVSRNPVPDTRRSSIISRAGLPAFPK